MRHGGATRPEDRVEVRRHRDVPLLLGALDQAPRHLDGGVVVEDVDPAEGVDSRGNHRVVVGAARHVGVHGDGFAPRLLDEVDRLAGAVVVHVGDGDAGAVPGEQHRRRPTLTRRGAGDERHLAVEKPKLGHARTVREP